MFQPNFRGSTNRPRSFTIAGNGEWGRKMQTDLSDGLAALAEKGIVDPDRACIVGASTIPLTSSSHAALSQSSPACSSASSTALRLASLALHSGNLTSQLTQSCTRLSAYFTGAGLASENIA